MMQNANRVDQVEGSPVTVGSLEGRMVNVALDHVGVRHAAYVCVRGVDRGAEIHPNDLFGSVTSRVVRVPAVSATSVENYLVAEELGLYGFDPIQKLSLVLVIELSELLPLEPEGAGGFLFYRRGVRWAGPGHAI